MAAKSRKDNNTGGKRGGRKAGAVAGPQNNLGPELHVAKKNDSVRDEAQGVLYGPANPSSTADTPGTKQLTSLHSARKRPLLR